MEAPQQPRRRRGWGNRAFIPLIFLLTLIGGFTGAAIAVIAFDDDPAAAPAPSPSASTPTEDIVDDALPAVVGIINEGRPRREGGQVIQSTSIGTGVIIDSRGFVVTNEHVIRDALRLTVVLSNGQELRGVLVSDDQPFTDIAVVRIEGGTSFPVLPLGDSDSLRPGEPIISIGNSLNYFPRSVTTGIISGLHRQWERPNVVMEDLIQTDAAVNHGNSGGPILNVRGEMVAMNTTVIRQSEDGEGVEGVALAISSKTIRDVAIPMIQQGSRERPTLGIEHLDISPESAVANGLPPFQGALVQTVADGSPAQRSGIRPNDIILSMGGQALSPDRPFLNSLMRLTVNRPVEIELLRGGARISVTVTPAARARQT